MAWRVGSRLFIPAGKARSCWVRSRARRPLPPDLPRFRVAWTPSTTLERRTAHKHAGRPTPATESGGLAPIGAEKSALTGSERSFQGLWAAAFSFPRIRQFVTHLPGSVSPEPRLQVNLARRSMPAPAPRRSGGRLQELHFLRRGRCPPQLALEGALRRLHDWLDGRSLDDATLAEYLAARFEAGHSPAVAGQVVAAVRFYAKLGDQASPIGPATARVLAGFRREGRARSRGEASRGKRWDPKGFLGQVADQSLDLAQDLLTIRCDRSADHLVLLLTWILNRPHEFCCRAPEYEQPDQIARISRQLGPGVPDT